MRFTTTASRRLARKRPLRSSPRRWSIVPAVETLESRIPLAADVILEWNAVALEVNRVSYSGGVVNDQLGPTRSSRALAIVHAAMFDAWNSINEQFTPYLTTAPQADDASDVAAVAQAAHDTLIALYPHQQPLIDTALTHTLRRVPDDDDDEAAGIAVGAFVARRILQLRAHDGSQDQGTYQPDGQIGHHNVDPLNPNQGFLGPTWGDVTPFTIPDVESIPTRTVPELTSSEYTAAFGQLIRLGEETSAERTTDQTEIGIYWGYDVARGLGDPPRLYNQVARVIAEQQENTVAENARMFTIMNLAMADASIQCWGVKYRDEFWRPIVAIRAGKLDGNPATVGDADWSPLGAPRTNPAPGEDVNFTPPFPSYTSGHATIGGSAFKSLANFYQTDDITFSIPFDFISDEFNGVSRDIHEAIPELILDHVRQIRPRHYESFSQAAAENAASRIFLGIHWRFDATEGVSAGNRIADYAFDHYLRPLDGPKPNHVLSVDFVKQIDAYLDGSYVDYFGPGGGGVVYAWHNNSNPMDVSNDGLVAPGDVLVVINELNEPDFHDATGQLNMPPPDPIPAFYDANRDRHVTALDALMAINYLNSLAEGEGETESIASESDHQLLPPILVGAEHDHTDTEHSRRDNHEGGSGPDAVFYTTNSVDRSKLAGTWKSWVGHDDETSQQGEFMLDLLQLEEFADLLAAQREIRSP